MERQRIIQHRLRLIAKAIFIGLHDHARQHVVANIQLLCKDADLPVDHDAMIHLDLVAASAKVRWQRTAVEVSQDIVVFVVDGRALIASCQAHPLAPVGSAKSGSAHVQVLVDLRHVVAECGGIVLRGTCKLRLKCLFGPSCFLWIEFSNQLLELDTGDHLIPTEIFTIRVNVGRRDCHVHEAVVGIKPLDAVAAVCVVTDGSQACSRHGGVCDDGLQRCLLPVHDCGTEVIFETIPEHLHHFTCPAVLDALITETCLKLHGSILVGGCRHHAKDGIASQEHASLISNCGFNLRHNNGDSHVLQLASISCHVATNSLDVLCGGIQLPLICQITIAQQIAEVRQRAACTFCAVFRIMQKLLTLLKVERVDDRNVGGGHCWNSVGLEW